MKLRAEDVIVITGASSGIGHATALAFARRGCRLVLASRSLKALESVAAEVRGAGAEVLAVPTDVADHAGIERLRSAAVDQFERIDVWINGASVAEWSPVADSDAADFERVIAVDLLGTMYGVRAALDVMRAQGRGTIINVASALAERSVPLLSSYCAAKAGVRAFTESLRLEMKDSGIPIDVVLVLPSSINTPFYSEARSRIGVRPRPISIVYSPEAVAEAIVFGADRPQRDIFVGSAGKLLSLAQRFSPRLVDAYMLQNRRMFREQYSDTRDQGESNLHTSHGQSAIHGAFRSRERHSSAYTETFEMRPAVKRTARAALTGALAFVILRQLRKGRARFTSS